MSRCQDVEVWILGAIGAGMGLVGAWLIDSYHLSENVTKAIVYTVIIVATLVIGLRPAWRRPRMWIDLAILLALHVALGLPVVNFLTSHSIRLAWFIALPFALLEISLFLGVLWRRNVNKSSP